ncbi:hypothetical protein CC85DRAFT_66593 [Cutaneotrichosporon oleaginosum]|uniref:Uncharacterized protein n=1 Tax=Cutaneotrichosporon oleaginosum TaxID=879819 RepID=A0A0J1B6A5_9TREE|nr:uncharacterized protein CC85DRAFT_66593 [Cutaneotrichosporon oleaginosum]KLT43254.1 hypothetical protein CC85DRAFT_66593 [Cutaneotrichosporon oleaginosum]TXT09932.1 hypothetical protein COLE_03866 [Cutaneotrichosporon oleaginosum]
MRVSQRPDTSRTGATAVSFSPMPMGVQSRLRCRLHQRSLRPCASNPEQCVLRLGHHPSPAPREAHSTKILVTHETPLHDRRAGAGGIAGALYAAVLYHISQQHSGHQVSNPFVSPRGIPPIRSSPAAPHKPPTRHCAALL